MYFVDIEIVFSVLIVIVKTQFKLVAVVCQNFTEFFSVLFAHADINIGVSTHIGCRVQVLEVNTLEFKIWDLITFKHGENTLSFNFQSGITAHHTMVIILKLFEDFLRG